MNDTMWWVSRAESSASDSVDQDCEESKYEMFNSILRKPNYELNSQLLNYLTSMIND